MNIVAYLIDFFFFFKKNISVAFLSIYLSISTSHSLLEPGSVCKFI
jgi:hypothetical protein